MAATPRLPPSVRVSPSCPRVQTSHTTHLVPVEETAGTRGAADQAVGDLLALEFTA